MASFFSRPQCVDSILRSLGVPMQQWVCKMCNWFVHFICILDILREKQHTNMAGFYHIDISQGWWIHLMYMVRSGTYRSKIFLWCLQRCIQLLKIKNLWNYSSLWLHYIYILHCKKCLCTFNTVVRCLSRQLPCRVPYQLCWTYSKEMYIASKQFFVFVIDDTQIVV